MEAAKTTVTEFDEADGGIPAVGGVPYFFDVAFVSDDAEFNREVKAIKELEDKASPKEFQGVPVWYEKKTEVFVDWHAAIVNGDFKDHERIENLFLIALASWLALMLMNKRSRIYLFEAFADRPRVRSTAKRINKRSMVYQDIADSILPIRWTIKQNDLYLLESIHERWGSHRLRKDIKERMKVLALHHQRLESEQKELEKRLESEQKELENSRITSFGTFLAITTVFSAVAGVISLFLMTSPKVTSTSWISLAACFLISSLFLLLAYIYISYRFGNKSDLTHAKRLGPQD